MPPIDPILPGEPEHTLTIKGGCVQVRVTPLRGQREELDGAGRGIDAGNRVLPPSVTQAAPSGPTITPCGAAPRSQCDQIRPAGPRIEPAEFARGLRGEPHRTIGRGIDIVGPGPRQHRKVRISLSACAVDPAVNITSITAIIVPSRIMESSYRCYSLE